MRYTFLILSSIFFASCSPEVKSPAELPSVVADQASSHVKVTKETQDVILVKDSSLFGNWVYEKIPNGKGANSEDQMLMRRVFGSTELSLTKDDYTLSMMETMDTGTWKNLGGDTYELKSASGKTQKVSLKKVKDTQLIFTFLGDKEIQMRKSEE